MYEKCTNIAFYEEIGDKFWKVPNEKLEQNDENPSSGFLINRNFRLISCFVFVKATDIGGRRRKTPPKDLELNKIKSIDSSSSSGESNNNFDSSQDCSELGKSTKVDKKDDMRNPNDDSKFAFYATVDERQRCEDHLKSVTETYERWLEALEPVKDEAGNCHIPSEVHSNKIDAYLFT